MAGLTKHVSSRKWNDGTYISSSVFFCAGNFNMLPTPTQLWNSLIRVSSTVNCSISQTGLLHSCLFLHRTHFILHVANQRSQQFDVSPLNVQMRWVLHVGYYPSSLYRHLCNLLCELRGTLRWGERNTRKLFSVQLCRVGCRVFWCMKRAQRRRRTDAVAEERRNFFF